MGKAHEIQKKTAHPALAIRKMISTINRRQTPPIQSSTQTHMDLWNLAVGASLQFQHRNPPALPIQSLRSILNAPWYYTNIHRIHEDLQMN
jgi:hypothetical protein